MSGPQPQSHLAAQLIDIGAAVLALNPTGTVLRVDLTEDPYLGQKLTIETTGDRVFKQWWTVFQGFDHLTEPGENLRLSVAWNTEDDGVRKRSTVILPAEHTVAHVLTGLC